MIKCEYDTIDHHSRLLDKDFDPEVYNKTLDDMLFSANFTLESKNPDGIESFRRYNLLTREGKFNTEEFEKYLILGAGVYNEDEIVWYPMNGQEIYQI